MKLRDPARHGQNPQKNLIYQIQRRNKSTGKSNKPDTHSPHIMFAKDIVPADHPSVTDHVEAFTKQICEVIVGKNQAVKLAVACLLARGHLLIEDIPGVGKTTLSQALARSLALAFQRIQFTSDLLPADILGNSIFDRTEQRFVFHRGPLSRTDRRGQSRDSENAKRVARSNGRTPHLRRRHDL